MYVCIGLLQEDYKYKYVCVFARLDEYKPY